MGREGIEKWIRENQLGWRLYVFKGKVKTVKQAASLLGVNPDIIMKTIILVDGEKTYAVILRGIDRVDLAKLSKITGGDPRIAPPREVLARTGYAVGGVPPAPLPGNVTVIIDRKVLNLDTVYAGGGDEYTLLKLNPRDLLRVYPNPIIGDVSS
ncbi:MAG: YbaK/EbsC family protein [Desulfurococcales archaeon]|nr:YbaK/EbsC family protein [Desulfurococcales archaeon]